MADPPKRFEAFRDAYSIVREASPRSVKLALIVDVASAAANALLLVMAGQILERMADGTTWSETMPYLLGASFALMVTMTGAALRTDISKLAIEEVEAHTIIKVLGAAASVPYTSFDSPGFYDRLQRAYKSGQAQAWTIAQSTLNLIKTLLDLAGIFAVLVFVAPALIGIALLAYVPLYLVTAANTRALYLFAWSQTEGDRRRSYISELLSHREAAKEVRVFDMFPSLSAQFNELWTERLDRILGVVRSRARRSFYASIVSSLVIAGALALVVWLTVEGQLSLADAGVGVIGVRQLSTGVGRANVSVSALHKGATYLRDYHTFIAEAEAQASAHDGEQAPSQVSEITFRDVSFSYPRQDDMALHSIDFTVRSGEVTAIVGANGSGKSTLMALLAGLYEPTMGTITWDGIDVTDFATASYHQAIAPLFQDFARFQLTAMENVTLDDSAEPGVVERVRRSLTMAGADEFTSSLPKGELTQLGRAFADGEELSIGQWQRLALARALYRDAPVVLLDEPASALDPIAEAALVRRLQEICQDRCVLLVSHRFASVSQADRIVVLSDGRLVEDGTHDQLLAAEGAYAALYRAQADQFAP